jgi:hypothetical protein
VWSKFHCPQHHLCRSLQAVKRHTRIGSTLGSDYEAKGVLGTSCLHLGKLVCTRLKVKCSLQTAGLHASLLLPLLYHRLSFHHPKQTSMLQSPELQPACASRGRVIVTIDTKANPIFHPSWLHHCCVNDQTCHNCTAYGGKPCCRPRMCAVQCQEMFGSHVKDIAPTAPESLG